jgi:peptide/nickel transport system permease protein
MIRYLAQRILAIIPLLLFLSLFTFILLNFIGNPISFYMTANVSAADMERLTQQFGLDRPILTRYIEWLANMVTGDWGNSLVTLRPVTELIFDRFPATLLLMGTVFMATVVIAIPMGILAALHRNKAIDYIISTLSLFAFSAPTFWTGIMAIVIFSLETRKRGLPFLPSGGMYNLAEGPSLGGILRHLILPAAILTFFQMARYVRFMRGSMVDVLEQDYIRTARAKGLTERVVIFKHAFRNSVLPIVTLMSIDLPRLLTGALITEQVFSWPGMGRLMVEHSQRADFPVLMGILMVIAALVAVFSIIGDVLYVYVDPRIRFD